MRIVRRIGVSLLAAAALFAALSSGDHRPAGNSPLSLVTPAEAIVGRPLTPVSVAGVARRTARRCAAGVYYC
jgi:hypothetical protein